MMCNAAIGANDRSPGKISALPHDDLQNKEGIWLMDYALS